MYEIHRLGSSHFVRRELEKKAANCSRRLKRVIPKPSLDADWNEMIWLDAIFRFSGIAFLILLFVVALRDGKDWNSAPFLALASLSVAALFIGYAPEILQPPEPIYGAARFLDVPHLVLVWLFALSLYDSNFRLRPAHVVIGVLYSLPIFLMRLEDYGLAPALPHWVLIYGSLTSIALMAHLCFATIYGRADDLLEARRASRPSKTARSARPSASRWARRSGSSPHAISISARSPNRAGTA